MVRYAEQFGEIVAQRLKSLNTNTYAAEIAAGLSADAIRNVLRSQKKSGPTLSRVEEICSALGLELYIGPPREVGQLPPEADPQELANIPLHEAFLSAGPGIENGSEQVVGHLAFRHDWLKKMDIRPANAVLARAYGDSMQPCIWDGDVLLIDRARTEPPASPKKGTPGRRPPIFALLDDGEAKVKRVQLQDLGMAALISDNPEYPPQFTRAETLTIIGKVIWWGHNNNE